MAFILSGERRDQEAEPVNSSYIQRLLAVQKDGAVAHVIQQTSTGDIISIYFDEYGSVPNAAGNAVNALLESAWQTHPNDVRYAGHLSAQAAEALIVQAQALDYPGVA